MGVLSRERACYSQVSVCHCRLKGEHRQTYVMMYGHVENLKKFHGLLTKNPAVSAFSVPVFLYFSYHPIPLFTYLITTLPPSHCLRSFFFICVAKQKVRLQVATPFGGVHRAKETIRI